MYKAERFMATQSELLVCTGDTGMEVRVSYEIETLCVRYMHCSYLQLC